MKNILFFCIVLLTSNSFASTESLVNECRSTRIEALRDTKAVLKAWYAFDNRIHDREFSWSIRPFDSHVNNGMGLSHMTANWDRFIFNAFDKFDLPKQYTSCFSEEEKIDHFLSSFPYDGNFSLLLLRLYKFLYNCIKPSSCASLNEVPSGNHRLNDSVERAWLPGTNCGPGTNRECL